MTYVSRHKLGHVVHCAVDTEPQTTLVCMLFELGEGDDAFPCEMPTSGWEADACGASVGFDGASGVPYKSRLQ